MKRKLSAILIGLLVFVLMATPVLAVVAYAGIIQVVSDADYTQKPVTVPMNIEAMIAAGYINADATDLQVDNGTIYLPFMPADDRLNFVAPSVTVGTTSYNLTTANTPVLTEFPIIPAPGGYVTVLDDAALEPGDDFAYTIEGYFDTSTANVGKNIVYKADAFRLYVSTTGNLTVEILGVDGVDVEFACPSGYHTINVTCDGITLGIGFADNTLNDDTAPSLVTTIADHSYMSMYYTRTIFYGLGYYWLFYRTASPTRLNFRTSTDGITWSSVTTLGADWDGIYSRMDVYFDGTYFHIAYAYNDIYYIRGTPSGDGTIVWDAEDLVSDAPSPIPDEVSIATDWQGYPWVSVSSGLTPCVDVFRSSTKDGTFTIDAAATTAFGTTGTRSQLYPSTANEGGMFVVLSYLGNYSLYEWKGSILEWGAEEPLASDGDDQQSWSFTVDNDNTLHLIYCEATSFDIKHKTRLTDGTLSGENLVYTDTSGSETYPTIGYLEDMTHLYALWANNPTANMVYYKPYNLATATWEDTIAWKQEDYTIPQGNGNDMGKIQVWYRSVNGRLPVEWALDKATDEIRFCVLMVDTPSETVPIIAAVPDEATDWILMDGDVDPYTTEFSYSVSSTEVLNFKPTSYIDADILPDTAGAAQDGTFTWGTNTAGVTAALTSFKPVGTAIPDPGSLDPGSLFPDIPDTIPEMYTEGDFSHIPGADIINKLLDEGDVPQMLWWYPFIYIGIVIIGFIVYGASRHGGAPGSLLLQFIVMEILIGAFGLMGVTPFFPALLFIIPGIAFNLKQNQFSWG